MRKLPVQILASVALLALAANSGFAAVPGSPADRCLTHLREVVESKAARNLKAQSLKTYRKLFRPSVCYRTSLEKFTAGEQVWDVPRYGVRSIAEEIADVWSFDDLFRP